MKRYKLIIIAALFSIIPLVYAAAGDILLRSVGDFIIKAENYVLINNSLNVDAVTAADGSVLPGWVPVGGMIAIMPSTNSNAWQPPSTGQIKDGFMRADGGQVPACADCVIPTGTTLPSMGGRFARGNTTSSLTPAGGVATVGSGDLPTTASSATISGTESAGHVHDLSHSHGSTNTNINSVYSAGHTHDATHAHDYQVAVDSQTHTHGNSVVAAGAHEHAITNYAGQRLASWYDGNGGEFAVFLFAPYQVNNWLHDANWYFTALSAGSHTHSVGSFSSGGTHAHTVNTSPSGNAPTNVNNGSHAHGTINYTGSVSDNNIDHSHNLSLTFNSGVTPSKFDVEPTNIEVIWVIRVR